MCLSSVEKHPRLTWFWIIAVSFLLSAALVVGFGIHSFHGLFATRCEKEIIASSPDGQYALIIHPWSGWDSTGADFYCRSSSGTTKIGGISAAGHNHPFRDGHYRIVWEPEAVTILYGTANLSQWETVTYHLQAVTETSIEKCKFFAFLLTCQMLFYIINSEARGAVCCPDTDPSQHPTCRPGNRFVRFLLSERSAVMKKHYALMLVILLFLSILCVTGCTETGGANVVYLPTRVNIRSYTSDYPNGRTVVSVVYKYDDSNHLQELVYQNYYGSYNFAVTTDGNGNVLTCDGSYQSSNDLISGIHESYTYTQDGKLLVSKSFPGPDSGTTKVRTYNSNGLLTQIKRTREHHVATHIVTMECAHDENGNIISIHNYRVNSGAKKLYSVTKFSYDEQGQRTEEVRYNGDGIRTCSIQYSYSDKGTIAHMESFTDDGQLWNTRMFTFDHTGNLIESHLISSSYESKTTYQYSYKKVPVSSAPQNIYVFHNTLPEIGISDWYDLVNVDS